MMSFFSKIKNAIFRKKPVPAEAAPDIAITPAATAATSRSSVRNRRLWPMSMSKPSLMTPPERPVSRSTGALRSSIF